MEPIRINSVQQGRGDEKGSRIALWLRSLCRDTALNLAVHRQKYHIVDLLLQYRANPNIYNQSGKTALHRAVASYIDENANQIRALFQVSDSWWNECRESETIHQSSQHWRGLEETRCDNRDLQMTKMCLRNSQSPFDPFRVGLIKPLKIEINEYLWMKLWLLINQVRPSTAEAKDWNISCLEILGILLSFDRNLKERAYRAAIIAARLGKSTLAFSDLHAIHVRLGHDECLKILLDSGMDPNITDRTHTTPLHVAYVAWLDEVYVHWTSL